MARFSRTFPIPQRNAGNSIAALIVAGGLLAAALPPFAAVAGDDARKTPTGDFDCPRAAGKVVIDGKLDDEAWKSAAVLDNFAPHWANRPARSRTVARMMWDDEYIYFAAEMEDLDLYADVTEHDGETWYNDVFELFFKPSEESLAYYEFEINARNTVFDCFIPSRGSGSVRRFLKAHPFHVESAVVLRGTLNHYQDDDEGWTVEGRIPWKDFSHTGGAPKAGDTWRYTLCRYDYSTRFEGPDLSTTAPLSRANFHHDEDYARIRFVDGRKNAAGR